MLKRRYKGFDYEGTGHPDFIPRDVPAAEPVETPPSLPVKVPDWFHKGGGYYESPTGEVRRGNPEA